ncbi:CotH kinase family protein [Flavobacterium sp. MAH-1]|uniref:CotH kinase family protein n=1 Tax=Flavobacterium agri TaxID=2743471 RepID=A0A7Y9C4G7_9FLAO|nr:CotH kinase family protein [Flavobacterium agri]NUY80131.1 CotH kinase family protein [Flavobacterium agri]NYA70156.1 CotH kinase family protein [Flavobacterium agri]
MKKITPFFIGLFLLLGASTFAQNLVINEILTSNTLTNVDEDGDYQDWVELYNGTAAAINLNGYGLTDDATQPFKWVFPAQIIGPGQYLIIYCSDKNRTVVNEPLHTNWKISSAGEAITLTNAASVMVDQVPATAIPSDISFGRLPNGSGPFVFFSAVTPAAQNGAVGYNEILNPPAFSQNGGFFTSAFNLTLSTTTPGATIIYTLDGSEPDPANLAGTTYQYKNQYPWHPGDPEGPFLTKSFNSLTYSGPISIVDRTSQPNDISMISTTYFDPFYLPDNNIFKGTVVRAKVVKAGALSSKTTSQSYFVTPLGSSRFSLPVVSLSISENVLFDYNDGIYVPGVDFDQWRIDNPDLEPEGQEDLGNYYRRGEQYEREANMSYFVNGTEVINQNVGLRLHGGSSRDWQNKSFNIYSRAEYGDETMDYGFFPNQPTDFERLILRNSGADFYETLFRDALNMRLLKQSHVLTKGYQPTITFMNGEYWGILSLSDKFDNNYFKRVFDIDDVDVLESEAQIEEGDDDDYNAMIDYIETHPLSVQANYDYILTQLDYQNFADYFIHNIYFDNIDWPGNNIVFWREKVDAPNAEYPHDGRWRWLAHDMDATFSTNNENINHNALAAATATNGPEWPNPAWSTFLLRKMLENPGFKNYFINRFADKINTSYSTAFVNSTMDEMKAVIMPELNEQMDRWTAPVDINDFNYYYGYQQDFATQRPAFQRNHIRSKFTIASNINATLDVSDVSHGYIKMNTIDIKLGTDNIAANPYPWTGVYFSGIPVTLKAIANDGFVFDHWEGASIATTDEITLTMSAAFSVKAVFVPTNTNSSEPIYFWYMGTSIPNDTPLTSLNSSFEVPATDAVIQYTSCLPGYPYTSGDPLFQHASMERRNSPTSINYIPEANGGAAYLASAMRGIQIKEPLQNAGNENIMVFAFTTVGYEDIKFSFAAKNELTNAQNIVIDYSTVAGTPSWTTAGLASSVYPLTSDFALFNVDFSSITAADNNANFKIRVRFTGTGDMTVDAGNRITFNNIAVHGTSLLSVPSVPVENRFLVYPNPTSGIVNVANLGADAMYSLFAIDGKLVKKGKIDASNQISLDGLTSGLYLLQLESDGRTETKKIAKQ